jgi:hypothetical protein
VRIEGRLAPAFVCAERDVLLQPSCHLIDHLVQQGHIKSREPALVIMVTISQSVGAIQEDAGTTSCG